MVTSNEKCFGQIFKEKVLKKADFLVSFPKPHSLHIFFYHLYSSKNVYKYCGFSYIHILTSIQAGKNL